MRTVSVAISSIIVGAGLIGSVFWQYLACSDGGSCAHWHFHKTLGNIAFVVGSALIVLGLCVLGIALGRVVRPYLVDDRARNGDRD